MSILQKIKQYISGAKISSAAYTGSLPSKSIKKGSKGADVKKVQAFLNWNLGAGLKVDGSCGNKTVAAIKKFQKKYGLKVDGHFGPKCRAKAQSIINGSKPAPTPKPAPAPSGNAKVRANICAWARKIAADNSYHYVKWNSKDSKTKECAICKNHSKGKYHGWNCIGFCFAAWRHGGGLKSKCNCHVLADDVVRKMYSVKTDAQALKIAQEKIGLKDIKVIRSKSNIPQSKLQSGDICCRFDGSTYKHMWLYLGNGMMADCRGSNGKVATANQISVRKAQTCKIAIRYTGN